MPPTLPNSRQGTAGSNDNLKVGPGEKTVKETAATPTGRPTSMKSGGMKTGSKAK